MGVAGYTSVETTRESIPFYDPDPGSSVGTFLELLRVLLGDALAAEETDDGAVQMDSGGQQRCCPNAPPIDRSAHERKSVSA